MKKKYLVVFDLETTGLDKLKDHVIQFAGLKVDADSLSIIEEKNLYIKPTGNYEISIASYLKHGIKPSFLEDKPIFAKVAKEIQNFLEDADILTYNGISFDQSFLIEEFKRVGIDYTFTDKNCYDAFLEEKRRNGINLDNTFKRYNNKTMLEAGFNAHDALSDVKATLNIFEHQQKIKKYEPEKLFGDDNFISESEFDGKLCPCFNVGKYRGVSVDYVSNIDQGYLKWACGDKSSMSKITKEFIKTYLV